MLLRRAAFASIVSVAFVSSGCGHQVTPDRLYDSLPGKMAVNFQVNGALDFTNVNYVVMFNTCPGGTEPYPNVFATSYLNYSYAFAVGGSFGGLASGLSLFEYFLNGNNISKAPVTLGGSTTQFVPDVNGQGNTFQVIFTRSQLANPLGLQTPCTNATPSPGPTTSPGATPSPSGANVWHINFFTIDANTGIVLDSLGTGGANDTTYNFAINVNNASQNQIVRKAGSQLPSNPNAQIAGGEIDNYP